MFTNNLVYAGKRWLYKGKFVRAVAETDSGNVKLEDGTWTSFHELTHIDGATHAFRILPLPEKMAA